MDFTLSPEIEDIRLRVRDFVAEHVLPLEADPENFTDHENIPAERLAPVREKAKKAGLWAPQMPKEFGGMGLPIVAWAAIYEEAARSIFGPLAIHCMAPDDGNMNLLAKVGTPAQKEKWLRPIVDGKVRSAFAMTEPHPGSGSDPGMMLTRAEKKGDRYVVHGHKWFITGAEGAAHFILIARTSDDPRNGLTAFLLSQGPARLAHRAPHPDHGAATSTAAIARSNIDGLEIPDENLLLNVGDGLRVTQIRLGPARLTHCMRWLGFAKRCMEIAQEYVEQARGLRQQARRAARASRSSSARSRTRSRSAACSRCTRPGSSTRATARARKSPWPRCRSPTRCIRPPTSRSSSTARAAIPRTRSLEWIYRYARPARLVDGASEVHKMVLARFMREEGRDFWKWG